MLKIVWTEEYPRNKAVTISILVPNFASVLTVTSAINTLQNHRQKTPQNVVCRTSGPSGDRTSETKRAVCAFWVCGNRKENPAADKAHALLTWGTFLRFTGDKSTGRVESGGVSLCGRSGSVFFSSDFLMFR